MSVKEFNDIIRETITNEALPGANYVIVTKKKKHFGCLGHKALIPNIEENTIDTIYDIASMSKVISTTSCALKLLEELGMVRKVTTVNNVERYDAMTYEHIHYVCDECGSVFDLPNFDNEVIKEKFSNEVGGEINWVNIILGGKCKHCREKLKN